MLRLLGAVAVPSCAVAVMIASAHCTGTAHTISQTEDGEAPCPCDGSTWASFCEAAGPPAVDAAADTK